MCFPSIARVLLFLSCGAGFLASGSQALSAPRDDHVGFWRLTPREGLPPAVVYCITQDSRGFLWFGTAAGVARFDGHEFRVFLPEPGDLESLANGAVLAIHEDTHGDMWMATEGGLDRWHRKSERFTHYRHDPTDPSSLSDNTTQAIAADPDGMLWIATARGGLNRFNPGTGKFQPYSLGTRTDTRQVEPWIRCLLRDRQGVLWIGTVEDGLYALDAVTGNLRHYRASVDEPTGLPDNHVFALAEDRAGSLWIGTQVGLCQLDPKRARFEKHPLQADNDDEQPTQSATAVLVDHDGIVWVGSDGAGFCRYDPQTRHTTRHRHSKYAGSTLLADAVRAVYEDRSGDIWIGHFPDGVSHFDRVSAGFEVFYSVPGEPNSLSDSHVLSFWEESNGDLWVGTDNGGVNRWSSAANRWTSYRYSPADPGGLGGKAATCVHRDHDNRLWVGTWDGGLNLLEPETGTFRKYVPEANRGDSLANVHVWQIAEDRRHRLWIATIGGGVEQYVPEKDAFVHHRYDPANPRSLNDDIVSGMLVTKDGTLWVGTPRGLARWNEADQAWDRFAGLATASPTLEGHWIFDLTEGRDGTLWYTTEGGGLNHLDPSTGRIENVRAKDGLPSDVLRGILADEDGALWIGSNRGLARFDPVTRRVRVYDESNGLPGSLFAPHARLRLASGDFLFGTTQGFIRFNPKALVVDRQPPPVALTSFEVFNERMEPGRGESPLVQSITETTRLEVPARLSVISFQFAALSFRSTAQIEYRFRLEGFDQTWRIPGPERRATFTNLDPGRYRFRVKAANGDGVWNETGIALDLIVVPAWWQTTWFKAGTILGLAALAAAVGWAISADRARDAQHRRELDIERERTRERDQAAAAYQVLNQQLEQRVAERTAQLSAAVKELEAFSYSVSHDLRAPLRSVDGFSHALLKDYGDRLDDEGKENLRTIRAATQRMGQLIDDLLELARVTQAGLQRSRTNLSVLATEIAKALKHEHATREIRFDIEPDLYAFCDPRLMQVALENLFSNACKFTGKRTDAVITFGCISRSGQATFFVRDNGVGFDAAYADKLFKAFKRLHSTTEFPGTGIGLATVDRIIRRHGGAVFAEAELDRGATFYFTLPDPT